MPFPIYSTGASKRRVRLIEEAGFLFNKIISANTQNYNLYSDAISSGWDAVSTLTANVTVSTGRYIWSDNSSAAFATGTLPAGSIVYLYNNGFIMGKGGNGGTVDGSTQTVAPTVGSTAINSTATDLFIETSNGYIGGGGGGGGSIFGILGGGGGAGGGSGGNANTTHGSGGTIGANGTTGTVVSTIGFGGGGGRIIPGANTTGPQIVKPPGVLGSSVTFPGNGGPAGGSGGAFNPGGPQAPTVVGTGGDGGGFANTGGDGSNLGGGGGAGGGGGYGAAGGLGKAALSNNAGALGGKAIELNSITVVTWVGGFNPNRVFGAVA